MLDAAFANRRPEGIEEGVVLLLIEEERTDVFLSQPVEIEFFVVVLECEVPPDHQTIAPLKSNADRSTPEVPTFWASV